MTEIIGKYINHYYAIDDFNTVATAGIFFSDAKNTFSVLIPTNGNGLFGLIYTGRQTH